MENNIFDKEWYVQARSGTIKDVEAKLVSACDLSRSEKTKSWTFPDSPIGLSPLFAWHPRISGPGFYWFA